MLLKSSICTLDRSDRIVQIARKLHVNYMVVGECRSNRLFVELEYSPRQILCERVHLEIWTILVEILF